MKKRNFLAGAAAMALCMAADWLLDAKGAGNVTTGVVESNWPQMAMWRFEVSILIAAAILPFYWRGIREMMQLLGQAADSASATERRMSRLFSTGAMAGVISFLLIHVICCLLPIIYKCFLPLVPNAAQLTAAVNQISGYVMLPFWVYFFVADAGMSVAFIYFIGKGRLCLPRIALLGNPLFTIFLGLALQAVPAVFLQNIAGGFESLGHVLLLLCGYWHCKNSGRPQNRFAQGGRLMKFAFIVMGNFDAACDPAAIHHGAAQMVGVSCLAEACAAAKQLCAEGVACIELCGAFGAKGAKAILEATENKVPVGYVTHLPEQDELYASVFPNG